MAKAKKVVLNKCTDKVGCKVKAVEAPKVCKSSKKKKSKK